MIDSEHYVDGSIDTAHIAADAVTGAKIADDAINSEHYTDGSVDTAHIADLNVTTAKIAADAITNAKIADDAIDSEHYAAASVDFAHIQNVAANSILGRDANSSGVLSEVALATTQILIGDGTGFTAAALSGDVTMTNAGVVTIASTSVETGMIAADAITNAKIADDVIDSEHYVDGSIDTAHLAADAVTGAKIADDAISEEHLDATVISGLSDTTIASADYLMFWDADDSALKKVDAAELISSGLSNIVEDTSPQLGGSLDVNGQDIVSTSNADIDIIPNGTGDVNLGADTVQVGDNNADATITTQGTGDLTLNTNNGTNSGSVVIADGANNDISLTPNGTGDVIIDGLKYPQADGSANQVLKTDGSGQLAFTTPSSGKVKQVVTGSDATLYSISVTNATSDHAGSIAYSITPTSASNKVKIDFFIPQIRHAGDTAGLRMRLYRQINSGGYSHVTGLSGTGASNRLAALGGNYDRNGDGNRSSVALGGTIVDSPSTTNQVDYKFYFGSGDGSTTVYVNRTENDTDQNYTSRTRTHVSLMEIE